MRIIYGNSYIICNRYMVALLVYLCVYQWNGAGKIILKNMYKKNQ